jgi:hypothetical protein
VIGIFGESRGSHRDGEPQYIAIEADGDRHIEHLQERGKALDGKTADFKGHEGKAFRS